MAAFAVGYAAAGALTIIGNQTESAAGSYTSTTNLAWWTAMSGGIGTVTSPLPTSLSTSSTSPTVLGAAGQTYLLNTGAAGDIEHFARFNESTSAPANTEVELTITVSTGTSATFTTVNVYLETQSHAPSASQVYVLAYDLGNAASTSIVLNSVQQIAQQCGSVGSCP